MEEITLEKKLKQIDSYPGPLHYTDLQNLTVKERDTKKSETYVDISEIERNIDGLFIKKIKKIY